MASHLKKAQHRKGSKTLANFAGHTNSAWYRQWADRGIASVRIRITEGDIHST
ncbi:hypothetical protein G6O69_28465 [Pseudenhygromyxa sp. WMMC2535]|uniref:hypothetical protein n=1 Tax=Pseudenhygromyxa sp. WMMC2535 TaxID=2712867 RepID=UPI00159579D9|nr:hypothetical protein [Pseudenhygromyxa sp. WMMC2535]NVB41800.1 hypothetical protein [Pseudenhygromyxa sp. WMMC2535]